MTPDRAENAGQAVQLLGGGEEDHDAFEIVLYTTARLDRVEDRRQNWPGHEHASHRLGHDRIDDHPRIKNLIIDEYGPRSAHKVGHQRLEAGRPLQCVKKKAYFVRYDRTGPERVEMLD